MRARLICERFDLDPDDFQRYWWPPGAGFARYSTAGRRSIEFVADYLGSVGVEPDAAVLAELDDELGRYVDLALAAPRVGVLDAVRALRDRGLRIGLLSNADEREARTWDASPLAPNFDVACFSCAIGAAKPDTKAYLHVLEQLGVGPARAAFVGDGMFGELQGARDAGFGLVVLMRGFLDELGMTPHDEMARLAASADTEVRALAELANALD